MTRILLSAFFIAIVFTAGVGLTRALQKTGESAAHLTDPLLALTGQTMGTQYHILLHRSDLTSVMDRQALQRNITQRLHHLDRELMSTYAPGSQLSILNASKPAVDAPLDPELLKVLAAAIRVSKKSQGALDITVKPLVDLWGFGAEGAVPNIPQQAEIDRVLARVGMQYISIDTDVGTITRTRDVSLDVSAVAKGYAVDQIALLLEGYGLEDYLVEIGGEVITRGTKPGGDYWQVGIEVPTQGTPALFRGIPGDGRKLAMAASGDYRNYFMHDGQRYSHILNPATGRPVSHGLASVTVIAESAMLADAWATALLVLGPEEGMELANDLQLAAYLIVTGTTGFKAHHSDAFNRYFQATQQ